MPIKKIIQSVLFLLFPTLFFAQTYHFTNYGVKDGLAQSNVSGIIQDSAGFYWLATDGGVSRFDGKNFINYTTEDGLADNNVSAIFLDRSNRIWLGHKNGSLTRYDGKTFTQIRSKLLPKDKEIYGFYQDKRGSLWICTASAGAIQIMDPSKELNERLHIKVYSGREGLSQYVFSASEDKEGNIWFMTDIGVKIMDKKTHTFDFFRPANMPLGQIISLCSDKDLNFIMGTGNGSILKYNVSTKTFETLVSAEAAFKAAPFIGPNFIYSVSQDSKGNIWARASNHGVYRYTPATKQLTGFNTNNGLSANKIKNIFEDNEGNILFSTSGEGFDIFAGERFVSFSKRNGLKDNQVWAICKDKKGRMWFGTNEGLTMFDPKAEPELAYKNIGTEEGLSSNYIRSIVEDRSGNLWIGTWGGKVMKYDMASSRLTHVGALDDIVNVLVSSLMIDKKNRLWIGTLEGIVIYDLENGSIKTLRTIDGLSDNDISCLFEDSKGRIWIGTKQRGVTLYDGKTFKKFNRENGLNNTSVSSIAEDIAHSIWIGTEGGGAFIYDGKSFKNVKTKNGLVSDFITLITSDKKNNIWLGTNKGLNRYDVKKAQFFSYAKGDGFTGLETKPNAVYADNLNNIWFGTVNGVFKYSPLLDIPVTTEPITKILKFQVNLKEYSIQEDVDLSYEDNSLIFDFIGISLSNAEGVYYKIKLEGYDEDWKIVKHTTEVYSNLPHNKYVFRLVACNSSGVCSQEINLKITINPPYYMTWWFYLIVISVVVSGLFAYIKLRERKLLQEKKILEDKVNERTAEVVEKNKELDEINKDITASIRYAKRIQDAILPPDDFVKKHLPNTFVLFKPKDIVSGDFYWIDRKGDWCYFAAVDCTGHGVPGAFMSIVGYNLLKDILKTTDRTDPAMIMDVMNDGVAHTLHTSTSDEQTKDGMDMTLCALNYKTLELQYAGAFNPLYIVRGNDLLQFKANKFPVGMFIGDKQNFTNNRIQLQKGDTIYIFSDGYADQFGGPRGKKFMAGNFRNLLVEASKLPIDNQKDMLNKTIENWRGNLEQVDDMLIIGVTV